MKNKIVMVECDFEGKTISKETTEFNSITQAAELTGIGSSSIVRSISGESRKTSGKGENEGKYFKFYNGLKNNALEDENHKEVYTTITTKTEDGKITTRYNNIKNDNKKLTKLDIQNIVNKTLEEGLKATLNKVVKSKKQKKSKTKNKKKLGNVAILSVLSDFHAETPNDIKRYIRWNNKLDELINSIIYNEKKVIDKVVIVLLGDFWHTDNILGTTTAGTDVKNQLDTTEIFGEMLEWLIETIETLTAKYAHFLEVEVIMTPGNHDRNKLTLTKEFLKVFFQNNEMVSFEDTKNEFKKFEWGKYIHYFTHGDKNIRNLPEAISTFNKELKDPTGRVFIHHGHFHSLIMKDVNGGTIIQHPTSVDMSNYEEEKGFLDMNRQNVFMVLDKEEGIIENHIITYNGNKGDK